MVATRFALAAHILLLLVPVGPDNGAGTGGPSAAAGPATSSRLAGMVKTNPVVVRRITGQLARAGLVRVARGPGGATLARPPEQITLDDVWRAVHADAGRRLLPLHAPPPDRIPLSADAHAVLTDALADAEATFRAALGRMTLQSLAERPPRPAA